MKSGAPDEESMMRRNSFPATDSARSNSLVNLIQPMGKVLWASSGQSQPEVGPPCEELGTKASVQDDPCLRILTMLVSLLRPGQMGRWVFQPLPFQATPDDPGGPHDAWESWNTH